MTNWQERLAKEFGSPEMRREMAVGRASAALSTLIAQRLAAKGMTQEQLAAALGITPGAVSRKLKEGCDMRLSSIAGILWALDVALYREFERLCDEGWRVKGPPIAETASIVAEGASVVGKNSLSEDLVRALSKLDDFLDERNVASIGKVARTERRDPWRDLLADTLRDSCALAVSRLSGAATPAALTAGLAQAEHVVSMIERALHLRHDILRERRPEALLRWNEFAREWEALVTRAMRSGLRQRRRLTKLARFEV